MNCVLDVILPQTDGTIVENASADADSTSCHGDAESDLDHSHVTQTAMAGRHGRARHALRSTVHAKQKMGALFVGIFYLDYVRGIDVGIRRRIHLTNPQVTPSLRLKHSSCFFVTARMYLNR